jgi:hypothetical protein
MLPVWFGCRSRLTGERSEYLVPGTVHHPPIIIILIVVYLVANLFCTVL